MSSPIHFKPGASRAAMLPGHSAPAAGFEEPFEMLATCHERVERMLALQGNCSVTCWTRAATSRHARRRAT